MGLTIPDLDDKTFEEIVQEAIALIPRFAPQWTDHNIHDPGITFIELFAWLAEMQMYQLNRVTEHNYQAFFQLLGHSPLDIQPAVVDITFDNVPKEKILEAGAQIIPSTKETIIFETQEDFVLVPSKIKAIYTEISSRKIDHTATNDMTDIYFSPFGEPVKTDAVLFLGLDDLPYQNNALQVSFYLFEENQELLTIPVSDPPEITPSAELLWEFLYQDEWHDLPVERDGTQSLLTSGRILFQIPDLMQRKNGLFWIRCRIAEGNFEYPPRINRILLNTISAMQIETIFNEELGEGLGIPGQKVLLNKAPVLTRNPAISPLIQVEKSVDEWEDWIKVADFTTSNETDRHYRIDMKTGEIVFGNGLNGCIPQPGQRIRAYSYQTSLAEKGNLPARLQWRIKENGFESFLGKNNSRASGGKAAEKTEDTVQRVRNDFNTRHRAITSDDYETLALATPGIRVARAKALPNYHPDYPCNSIPGAVTVIVLPFSWKNTQPTVPGNAFLATVLEHLDAHRLITTDLHVIAPVFVGISVSCKIYLKRKSSPSGVEQRVTDKLEAFLDPITGGPDKKGWRFGRSVYSSEIYQLIDLVEGVENVTNVILSSDDVTAENKNLIKIPLNGLVFSGTHSLELISRD